MLKLYVKDVARYAELFLLVAFLATVTSAQKIVCVNMNELKGLRDIKIAIAPLIASPYIGLFSLSLNFADDPGELPEILNDTEASGKMEFITP